MKEIKLSIDGVVMEFDIARTFAEVAAGLLAKEFMLIAWYDGQKGEEHPAVPECQHKPGWLAYAEGHGGNIKVDLNQGEFIFVFTSTS